MDIKAEPMDEDACNNNESTVLTKAPPHLFSIESLLQRKDVTPPVFPARLQQHLQQHLQHTVRDAGIRGWDLNGVAWERVRCACGFFIGIVRF